MVKQHEDIHPFFACWLEVKDSKFLGDGRNTKWKKLTNRKSYPPNALINGYMFIADELNLSSVSNMNALAPALEMNLNISIQTLWSF